MFWGDLDGLPKLELNCRLVKIMLESSLDEWKMKVPADEYVEKLTKEMEHFLATTQKRQ